MTDLHQPFLEPSIKEIFKKGIKASYHSRASQREYGIILLGCQIFILAALLLGFLVAGGMSLFGPEFSNSDLVEIGSVALTTLVLIPIFLATLGIIITSVIASVRRAHDVGWPGWIVVLVVIFMPIAYALVSILLLCKKGDPHPNKYGDPPDIDDINDARLHPNLPTDEVPFSGADVTPILKTAVRSFFSAKGRTGQLEYGIISIGLSILFFIAFELVSGFFKSANVPWYHDVVSIVISLILLGSVWVADICASIRRAHDLGWNGKRVAIWIAIPGISLIMKTILLYRKGQRVANEYGDVPKIISPDPIAPNTKESM